jgi:hypothetical protein
MTRTFDTAPLSGTFSDRARAQAAVDALMSEANSSDTGVDLVLYGSQGEYVLLVEAKSRELEKWVVRVLREHGAVLQEQVWPRWLVEARNATAHDVRGTGSQAADDQGLLTGWARVGLLFVDQGLLRAEDLLALLLVSGEPAGRLSRGERQRRMREADAELREVSARLEATLRTSHPELFDTNGRLRPRALARRLAEATGGKSALSGDELRALEDEEDEAGRSVRAP